MPDDIYSRPQIVTPTDEHLLLNALGGQAVVRDLIDRATNSSFGETIDTALADAVLPVRALLGARSGEGERPPAYRGATSPDGTVYNVLSGGKPEISTPKLNVTNDGSVLKIEGVVRNEAELRRILRRTVSKYGLDMPHLESLAQRTVEAAPQLSMQLQFTAESSRALVKMACNLFARAHRTEFMSRSFDDVRAFVLDGTGVASQFLVFNTKPVDLSAWNKNIGPLDHVLVVRALKGEVTALVAIYEPPSNTRRCARGSMVAAAASTSARYSCGSYQPGSPPLSACKSFRRGTLAMMPRPSVATYDRKSPIAFPRRQVVPFAPLDPLLNPIRPLGGRLKYSQALGRPRTAQRLGASAMTA